MLCAQDHLPYSSSRYLLALCAQELEKKLAEAEEEEMALTGRQRGVPDEWVTGEGSRISCHMCVEA